MATKEGLVVTVSPSASAFFAGELCTATITLTNSYSPAPPPPQDGCFPSPSGQRPSPAPHAPPSSWGSLTPTSARTRPPSSSQGGLSPPRGAQELPSLPYLPSSVGGSPYASLPAPLDEDSPVEASHADYPDDAAFPPSASSSAPAPPTFPRRPTFGRQRSQNYPYGHSRASLSTLSLASDDSDDESYEGNNGVGNGFYGGGRNDTMESLAEADYRRAAQSAGPLTNRIASAPAPSPYAQQPGSERSRSQSYANGAPTARQQPDYPPNTLSLLWAFAHLEGSFEVDESLIKPAEFLEVKRLIAGGLAGVGVGGGTLEERKEQGGWRGWFWGRKPVSVDDGRGAGSLEERKDRAVKDRAVPTFSCPPSILGVDLVLEPGQSKSFTFTIRIPADLPPSFRGKAIKFSYHLVVGTNRVALGPSLPYGYNRESVSRVMRVPVRVYNHVGVTGARPFYDLTNPVIFQRDEATVVDTANPTVPIRKSRRADHGKQEFEAYAANLLDSVVSDTPEIIQNASLSPTLEQVSSPTMMDGAPGMRPEMSSRAGGGEGTGAPAESFSLEADESSGCKTAVEIVSRNSQKVSYDINKDGYQVASLTLVKSAYRLGETVNGSVVINSGEGRVLRVSARLETYELVETSISTMPAPRMRQITRRLHSEHHEMTLDAARVGFALAIPSGATPDFGTSGVKLQWSVRLSFLFIPPSPDAGPDAPPTPGRRSALGFGSRPPPPPPARVPPGAPPSRHGRSKSFAYGFEPAVPLTLPPPPMIAPSGAAHLMPVLPRAGDSSPVQHVSYRAVPDLGFVPVPFSSAAPEPPPSPGPLQKTALGAHHRHNPSMSLPRPQSPLGNGSVVLVPAKVETVECSIPIKVYPSNTPFRPTVTVFDA
ncbi:hypothetical protein JCM10213_004240 [Rhodosporidiobolus nylandii]